MIGVCADCFSYVCDGCKAEALPRSRMYLTDGDAEHRPLCPACMLAAVADGIPPAQAPQPLPEGANPARFGPYAHEYDTMTLVMLEQLRTLPHERAGHDRRAGYDRLVGEEVWGSLGRGPARD